MKVITDHQLSEVVNKELL